MDKALNIAKNIITECMNENEPISNLQLQKILYFLQYQSLKNGDQLFDDDFEAWQFGPVIPEVYRRFSIYGGRAIRRTFDGYEKSRLSQELRNIVREKRRLDPWDLVDATHNPRGAWAMAYNRAPKSRIDKKSISQDTTIEV